MNASQNPQLSELAARVYHAAHLTGTFRLRSGATSTEYFDKYRIAADPALLRAVAEHLRPMIPAGTEALAGLELGGVPIAIVLSQLTGIPALFVRKQAKTYGTCQLTEGGSASGRRLLVVEDVIGSGGQTIESAQALRAEGARVQEVLCLIDRETGGAENLLREGLSLTSLFRRRDFPSAMTTDTLSPFASP
ncbi:MAG: orotate phosphoribosyltransferase [Opitutaceae bacterium]